MVDDHWHYLMPDGAVSQNGIVRHIASEIGHGIQGNHFALCGSGNEQGGAQAFLEFLRGKVCPQPLALVLAGHAVLALIHRFMGQGDRPLVWISGETGSHKSSLVRAGVLALWGPGFTAERGDGGSLPKWDSTYNGLEALLFTYRDALVMLDDYKQATSGRDVVARVLHAYSEGSSRSRMTKDLRAARSFPARCIAIATGEDIPTADPGQLGRVLLYQLHKNDVDKSALSNLQRAGVDGHLAAFWCSFIGELAKWLDSGGTDSVRRKLQHMLRKDDEALPGHQRSVGALRQNRAAWLLLRQYLQQSGYISQEEGVALDYARRTFASQQQHVQRDERPSTIVLNILREGVATGEYLIEQDGETPSVVPERVIGFEHRGMIEVFPEKLFKLVEQQRGRRHIQYTEKAVYEQFRNDDTLAQTSKDGRTTKTVKYRGQSVRVLLFRKEVIFPSEDDDTRDTLGHTTCVTENIALESDKQPP